ncbi:MAG: hypothetical protein ROZ00_01820 [Denitratisoma sp.]|nr:hypothetical protein [Denitratisoma sp.]
MQETNVTIATSFSDFQRLKAIHQAFVEEIQKQEQAQLAVASLKVVEGALCVSYLELEFRAVRRSVAVDFRLIANEYAFVGSIGDQEHVLLCLYLSPDGNLHLKSSLDDESRLCDYNNQYLVKNILTKIQLAALSSSFFAPHG